MTAVVPAWAQMKRYFSQSTRRIAGDSSAGIPAPASASRRRSARELRRPSSSPRTIRPPNRCAITPGASSVAKTYAAPPSALPAPSTASIRSSLSTPFWSERTAVSGPTTGRSRSAAASVSNDFTQNSTASAAGCPSSDATAVGQVTDSPSTAERTRSPSRRSASRCAPRATSVTRSPARASLPPK